MVHAFIAAPAAVVGSIIQREVATPIVQLQRLRCPPTTVKADELAHHGQFRKRQFNMMRYSQHGIEGQIMWTAPMRWSDFSLNVWWAFRPLLALLVEAIRLALKTRQWPLAPAVCIRAMSEAARCCSSAAMLR